ncbi:MAG: 8-amino-7-oxononanoate synthase [Chloroflexi bacterium]|nr:8-amino-7-oxononanoate synthase [Chloroflexota bacterium]
MNTFEQDLGERLQGLRERGLYRELRRVDSPQSSRIEIQGRSLLNFSSNDYLGLANHPLLKEAAIKAVGRYGAGSGASRLICGSLAPFHELEEALAHFKGAEAALTFSTGYAAAAGVICALLGKEDFIVTDKLVHACLVDAARLCGAKLRLFAHNDLNDLEEILRWVDRQQPSAGLPPPSQAKAAGFPAVTVRGPRTLIVTETVFSMDGDHAPLRALVELKERHGAWLMVDEAHATGLYGEHGRGLAAATGVGDRIEIQMGTLGKALGAAGGYICGSRLLIDYLINRARTFIFSTAPVPAAAAAALAGLRLVASPAGEERRNLLWQRVDQLLNGITSTPSPIKLAGHGVLQAPGFCEPAGQRRSTVSVAGPDRRSAIIPCLIGGESQAVETAVALRAAGLFVPAIRYPTVARGTARLRLTLSASHTAEDVARLLAALADLKFPL